MADRETQRALESIAVALNRIAMLLEADQKDTKEFRLALIDTIRSLKEETEEEQKK